MNPVEFVQYNHIEWNCCHSLFFISADIEILMIASAVS